MAVLCHRTFCLIKAAWPKFCKKSVFVILSYLLLSYGGTISTILHIILLSFVLEFPALIVGFRMYLYTHNGVSTPLQPTVGICSETYCYQDINFPITSDIKTILYAFHVSKRTVEYVRVQRKDNKRVPTMVPIKTSPYSLSPSLCYFAFTSRVFSVLYTCIYINIQNHRKISRVSSST